MIFYNGRPFELACVAAGPRTRLNPLYTEGLERLRRRLPFEPEIIMRNSFDIRAYANFFKQRLWQKKMVLKKQSHFTKH